MRSIQIEEKYEELKVDVSNIDASIKLAVESGSNKTIVVANDLFKFLEKYGYTVISLEENSNLTDKTVADVKQMIENEQISYIFLKEGEEENDTIKSLVEETGVETLTLKTLSNMTEEESENNQDYITLMNQNIETLKQELYDE